MNLCRFDDLTRSLSKPLSRRGVARTLTGLTLGGILTSQVGHPGVEARRKKKRKRKTCLDCGPCRECVKGMCVAKSDGTICEGERTCRGGACPCNPGTTDVAGRCTEPCGATCQAPCNCRVAINNDGDFCARDIGLCANRIPCQTHDGCASNELCSLTGCPAVNGVTNKCVVLC
jgi:hypothetical protein